MSILYKQESLFSRFYWWPCGHKMCKIFSKLCQMYEREFFRQPVPSAQPRFCFISQCCLSFMYDREYSNNFIFSDSVSVMLSTMTYFSTLLATT